MPSPWSPALHLPRCLRRMLTRSRRHLRPFLLEDLHAYLPFTSRDPPRASIPPTLPHRSKRRPPPHKWACSPSPLPLPHHAVWWTPSQWTDAKMLMVLRTTRQKSSGSRPGHDQRHRRRWIPTDDGPRDPLDYGIDLPPFCSFYRDGMEVRYHPLAIPMDYASHLHFPLFLSCSHYRTHAVLRPAEPSRPFSV